jgi:Zn-dependent M28 family amino/carboxypeptidase
MNILASDELKGRDTGSEGIEKAAVFLEERLKAYGVSPYFESYRDTLVNSKEIAYNIVGMLEGSDPRLKNEFIVIGAHYDHIGVMPGKNGDGIANGANDNASGTSTVLELARYFGGRTPPKRSLIFAFFSAEERGLLGSRHLARVLKERGIDLYTMLNFEMTGVPMEKSYLMYLTGYEKSNLADLCNQYGGADLVGFLPTASEYNLFLRSDNYPFYEEFKVPSHTFSSFDFENYAYYHQPGDEPSRMDFSHMANLVNRVIPAISGIANADRREITLK